MFKFWGIFYDSMNLSLNLDIFRTFFGNIFLSRKKSSKGIGKF